MEILVHISAPTSLKDDERYRKLAEAYNDFEATIKINCTIQDQDDSAVAAPEGSSQGETRQDDAELYRIPEGHTRTDQATHILDASRNTSRAHSRAVTNHHVDGDTAEKASNQERNGHIPVTAGDFVRPGAPASQTTASRTPVHFAQAPDFGSFMSSSRTPIERPDELERHWLHQQRSLSKRPASRLSRPSTGGTPSKEKSPDYIEDTQQAYAALEDHTASSSFGGWPTSSPEISPIAERAYKRPRLSTDAQYDERSDTHIEYGESFDFPSVFSPWPPGAPPRTPPRNSLSSQMPDDYSLSDSQSTYSFRGSDAPKTASQTRTELTPSPGFEVDIDRQRNSLPADASRIERLAEQVTSHETTVEAAPHQSQTTTEEDTEDAQTRASELASIMPTVVDERMDGQAKAPANTTERAQTDKDAVRHDFASLPIQLWSPPPPTGKKSHFDELTEMLKRIVTEAPIAKYYRPESVSRPIKDTDRGCWMFDTTDWTPEHQWVFWTRMQLLLDQGFLGDVWCQRNMGQDWRSDGTDGKEAAGLGVVWLFCWGQVAAHVWIVLLVESHREIRKSRSRWTVGPMEDLEVVVQMP